MRKPVRERMSFCTGVRYSTFCIFHSTLAREARVRPRSVASQHTALSRPRHGCDSRRGCHCPVMIEISQTKPNPNGVPYYSPGLPESARATLGLHIINNTTLKGLHNTLFNYLLCNPCGVVFINEREPRVGSFVANPGLYYETPLGFYIRHFHANV